MLLHRAYVWHGNLNRYTSRYSNLVPPWWLGGPRIQHVHAQFLAPWQVAFHIANRYLCSYVWPAWHFSISVLRKGIWRSFLCKGSTCKLEKKRRAHAKTSAKCSMNIDIQKPNSAHSYAQLDTYLAQRLRVHVARSYIHHTEVFYFSDTPNMEIFGSVLRFALLVTYRIVNLTAYQDACENQESVFMFGQTCVHRELAISDSFVPPSFPLWTEPFVHLFISSATLLT